MLSRRLTAAAIGAFLSSLPAICTAQSPMVDPAIGPIVGRLLPRTAPRSAAMPELFAGLDWVRTPALNTAALIHEDSLVQQGPRRMGVVQPVGLSSAAGGRWTQLEDDGWLWVARIQATGALGARLKLTPWPPVSGGQVTLYNADDPSETFGPLDGSFLTGDTSLWSPNIYSASIHVEYYVPPGVDHLAPGSQITIDQLLNEYRTPLGTVGGPDEEGCHLDVSCYSNWASAASGVAALSAIDNQFGFFCTGSIMNRSPADFTPLFQTATHCRVDSGNASTTLVTWFFQTTSCNGSVPPLNTLPQTLGSVLLARDVGTDWTLIGLMSGIPAVTYEGWDSNYFLNLSSITNISHPGGTRKRIAFGTKLHDFASRPDPGNPGSCTSGTAYNTTMPSGNGLTEPGSSGSPLFDTGGRIRAVLSCGSDPSCTSAASGSWGRLDQAFPALQPFLTPPDPVFTNAAHGGAERGTAAEPFQTVRKSTFSVIRGHTIHIEGGVYHDRITIDKPMTLQARNGVVTIGP